MQGRRARSRPLGAPLAAAALFACTRAEPVPGSAAPPAGDAGAADVADAAAEEPPSWLGDAGLSVRAPVERPLRELCGIAMHPGIYPLGADPASAQLRARAHAAAKDLGGVMLRRDFLWSEIEPAKGTFAFDAYDVLAGEAAANGVRLLGLLAYGASWSNPKSGGDTAYPPADPADFAAYAKATAARYAGKVVAWEVWNEPNSGFRFWKGAGPSGDPAGYGALLKATYAAVRAADPAVPVLLGGTVFTPQFIQGGVEWLGAAYAAHPDLASYFDVAGIHAYAEYPPARPPEVGYWADPPLEAKIQMHAWLLGQHAGASKPIWITEIGWPVAGKVDDAAQARFLVRATILAARAGAAAIFWFTLRDGPHPETFPPEDAFGLLRNDATPAAEATPKPAYGALRTMIARVGDRWASTADARVRDLPSDGFAVRFRGAAGKDVVAAWTVETQAAARWDGTVADAFGQDGAPRGEVPPGGSLAVGPDVVWIAER